MGEGDDEQRRNGLAARNKRLAIGLGLLAVGIYLFYILSYVL